MTTMRRLPLSIGGRAFLRRGVEHDDKRILVERLAQSGAKRRFASGRIGSDGLVAAGAGLYVRLLPDDVVDALFRELGGIREMDGVAETEFGRVGNLARAAVDAQSGQVGGQHGLPALLLPAWRVPVVA